MLWLGIVLPILVVAYYWVLRARKRVVVHYSDTQVIRAAVGSRWKRHIPPVLFFLGLAGLVVAMGRPEGYVKLLSFQQTIILAIDISGSMEAKDIKPNRMEAVKSAVREFIDAQPPNVYIGIVTYTDVAAIAQVPTRDREMLHTAVNELKTRWATAIGEGILVSMKALFPKADFDRTKLYDYKKDPDFIPADPGSYGPAAIILLSDGWSTEGIEPLDAARWAADWGVRVFTVGVGTPDGYLELSNGTTMKVRLDEETLKGVAHITGGEYFYADKASAIKEVYNQLSSLIVLETKRTELTAFFVLLSFLVMLSAGGLSVLWFYR